MFLIDDIVLRLLGISVPGLDTVWLIELISDFANKELGREIKDKIKENRMLYELGEITVEEYRDWEERLLHKLKFARRVEEMNLNVRMDILRAG